MQYSGDRKLTLNRWNLRDPHMLNDLSLNWLTCLSLRFFVMFFIMPETEQRSLEDIELHYSDNSKGITDIDICRNAISISECKA